MSVSIKATVDDAEVQRLRQCAQNAHEGNADFRKRLQELVDKAFEAGQIAERVRLGR